MSDLSPELRQLVLAGKMANQPTAVDSARVFKGLEIRLGVTAGVAVGTLTTTVSESAARTLGVKTIGLATAGVLLAVGGIALMAPLLQSTPRASAPPADNTRPIFVPPPEAVAESAVAIQPVPATAELNSAKPGSTAAPTRASVRSRDSLSDEVAILTRAETELHGGRAESALRLLNEHERRFRNGILAEERTAARIQALCALGRVSEADVLRARLSPKSLHGEQTKKACSSSK